MVQTLAIAPAPARVALPPSTTGEPTALGVRHLLWIPAGASVAFLAAFAFGDFVRLPVDVYYGLYFAAVLLFFRSYARSTGLRPGRWFGRRLAPALLAGAGLGVLMVQNVLSRPATEALAGGALAWALLWRGVAYGTVDGLLMFAFPWLVVWRAFGAGERPLRAKLRPLALAWVASLFVTSVYHLGYADFRSAKLLQPNVGSAVSALPTLLTQNPAASTLTHVMLHVAAVWHSPDSELFLPPHGYR